MRFPRTAAILILACVDRTFERLLAEAAAVPVEGWDFSWFAGRASEERPSWGYAGMLAERIAGARSVLDIQTGGGEVYAEAVEHAGTVPRLVVAVESWRPNLVVARQRLRRCGGTVLEIAERANLPFGSASFDLSASRHPTGRRWDEIARVLTPGGRHLSQGVGAGSNRELSEAIMGPLPPAGDPTGRPAAHLAERAGLVVTDLRHERIRLDFGDVGAVAHFLRKVVWTVPDFTIDRYRNQLRHLHEQIETAGPFVSHAHRYLIEARKPR
jgi:SAM-dependent methyltransferase